MTMEEERPCRCTKFTIAEGERDYAEVNVREDLVGHHSLRFCLLLEDGAWVQYLEPLEWIEVKDHTGRTAMKYRRGSEPPEEVETTHGINTFIRTAIREFHEQGGVHITEMRFEGDQLTVEGWGAPLVSVRLDRGELDLGIIWPGDGGPTPDPDEVPQLFLDGREAMLRVDGRWLLIRPGSDEPQQPLRAR